MDPAQEILYGVFPRRVGVGVTDLRQFWVYSEEHFDMVYDRNIGERNVYSTLSWFDRTMMPVSDKITIDFDSPMKPDPGDPKWGYDEAMKLIDDEQFADDVLGPVADDVNALAEYVLDRGQAAFGVFTGFGVHFHLLYEPKEEPAEEMETTVNMLEEELDLESVDAKPVGDEQRIMRVPNVERIETLAPNTEGDDRTDRTSIWTVPLTVSEMESVTPIGLLEKSSQPRLDVSTVEGERAKMEVYEDYRNRSVDVDPADQSRIEVEFDEFDDEVMKGMMEDLLQMPCMYERIIQPEPEHPVRQNSAVLLFNIGYKPEEVFNLFRRLGWRDWDPSVTKKQLKQIYQKGYADMSCQTIQRKGLCRRAEDPPSCRTFGWSGGQVEWKETS